MSGTPLKLDGLLAKVEGTYATDATPGNATDGVRLSERIWNQIRIRHEFPNTREDSVSGSLIDLAQPGAPKGRVVDLEFGVELAGAGAAYSATVKAMIHDLLLACGLSATLDSTLGAENYAYNLADEGHDSVTIHAYGGGKVYKIVGCRGNVRWPITAGALGTVRFSLTGIMLTDPATAALPSITYDAVVPKPATGMTLTLGAWSPDMHDGEFDLGNRVEVLHSVQDSEGIDGIAIVGAAPTMRISARTVALATYDPYTDLRTPTSAALAMALGASGAYNRWELADSAAWLQDPIEHPEDKDHTAWGLSYRLTDPTLKAAS